MNANFVGKVAIVTGGARGIGEQICAVLVERGATVIVADRDGDAAAEAAAALGTLAISYTVDVTSSSSVKSLIQRTVDRHGRLDILINNAGMGDDRAAENTTDEDWRRVLAVNLDGTFYGAREAGRYFRSQGLTGVIINVASIAAMRASRPERHLSYDVAKAGVAHMTRVLGAEWAPSVRVNAIAPGYTETPILQEVGLDNPEIVSTWLDHVPQKRFIQPREIANAVAFLASDDASAITGHVLVADAGYTAI